MNEQLIPVRLLDEESATLLLEHGQITWEQCDHYFLHNAGTSEPENPRYAEFVEAMNKKLIKFLQTYTEAEEPVQTGRIEMLKERLGDYFQEYQEEESVIEEDHDEALTPALRFCRSYQKLSPEITTRFFWKSIGTLKPDEVEDYQKHLQNNVIPKLIAREELKPRDSHAARSRAEKITRLISELKEG